jgi:hypothetical protein
MAESGSSDTPVLTSLQSQGAFSGFAFDELPGTYVTQPTPDKQTGPGGSTWTPLYTQDFYADNVQSSVASTYASGNQIVTNNGGTTWTQSADGTTWTANATPVVDPNKADPNTICTQTITVQGSVKSGGGSVTLTNACPVSGTGSLLSYIGSAIGGFVTTVATAIVTGVEAAVSWTESVVSQAISWITAEINNMSVPAGYPGDVSAGYAHSSTPIGNDLFPHGTFSLH